MTNNEQHPAEIIISAIVGLFRDMRRREVKRLVFFGVLMILANVVGALIYALWIDGPNNQADGLHAGSCYVDLNGAPADEQGLAAATYACVPTRAPDGSAAGRVWEDGSADYAGGRWVFDPEEHGFMPAQPTAVPMAQAASAVPTAVPAALAPAPAALAPLPPVEAGLSIPLTDSDCAYLGLPSNGYGQCVTDTTHVDVVAISAPDVDDAQQHPGVVALRDAGFTGEAGDSMSAIYAPVDTVLFDEHGTWTVTPAGLARCEHGSERACDGSEWVR